MTEAAKKHHMSTKKYYSGFNVRCYWIQPGNVHLNEPYECMQPERDTFISVNAILFIHLMEKSSLECK